jgi:branched-chain amino acid transport system substrate-binding protein
VGTTSGIVGATVGAGLPAVRAWVASVNATGGINGHPLKFFAADDGADPSRHRRLVQELVERDKVIAFPFMAAPLSGHGGIDYITQKGIPVTGDSGASTWYYDSPMYFPQMSSGSAWIKAMLHAAAAETVPQGKTKLAMVNCQEAQFCVDADRMWPEEAPKVGYQVVFKRQASIAQPDYTAECLGARNAGADVFAVAMDNASVTRMGSACTRVGYHPIYLIHHSGHALDQASDPNLDGMLVPLATRAWFDSSNPAVAAYQKALATYSPGATNQPVALAGWTGAQLFQLAATRAPDPTTSTGILEGLWSLNGETLGDITLPLKFNRNQNATPVGCWFMVRANKGKWEYTPGGNALKCIK